MDREPFTGVELSEITDVLNSVFLQSTDFKIENLRIDINKRYFFENSKHTDTTAYVPSFDLSAGGESVEHESFPFTVKTSPKDIAFHIAHEIWGRFDGRTDTQLWKNLQLLVQIN